MTDNELLIEYIEKMKNAGRQGNNEDNHIEADVVLCELLTKLGYDEVVANFKKIYKWYA